MQYTYSVLQVKEPGNKELGKRCQVPFPLIFRLERYCANRIILIRLEVLIDTIMIHTSETQQSILHIFLRHDSLSSSQVHKKLIEKGGSVSLVTVKRELSDLKERGLLETSGAGRSVTYTIHPLGRLCVEIGAKEYTSIDPDKRYGLKDFNFDLFDAFPAQVFTEQELEKLEKARETYLQNVNNLSKALEEKELERFVIELSWKSSKIEGNTYTLLDTEKLIKEGERAPGHDEQEAQMILNHKDAFKFVRENKSLFKKVSVAHIEELHRVLVKGLNVNYGLRNKPVGITGSTYRPLDNSHQIKEAMTALCQAIELVDHPAGKAMIALLGTSYIQPFEDGNKRTARLLANAILLAHGHPPLSYRSVDDNGYKEATLVFYELNSLIPFKEMFIEQYVFAAENYAV